MQRWRKKPRQAAQAAGKGPGPGLKVKKLDARAVVPTRGTTGSAGLDLYALDGACIRPGDIVGLRTGLAFEIPEGHFGLLATRSSMGMRGVRIAAGANIIDADYRGEVVCYLRNDGEYGWDVKAGDRVAQMAIVPYLAVEPEEALELSPTARGSSAFGSTGR